MVAHLSHVRDRMAQYRLDVTGVVRQNKMDYTETAPTTSGIAVADRPTRLLSASSGRDRLPGIQ